MKLKNKRTGEIGELQVTEKHCAVAVGNGTASCGLEIYSSLARLYEEWEDYEEPKDHYYIDYDGDIMIVEALDYEPKIKEMKQIGNYFGTREEAEKVMEKLKAVKRLKDKEFKITEWKFTPDMKHIKGNFITIKAEIPYIVESQADLDLLFGGEE